MSRMLTFTANARIVRQRPRLVLKEQVYEALYRDDGIAFAADGKPVDFRHHDFINVTKGFMDAFLKPAGGRVPRLKPLSVRLKALETIKAARPVADPFAISDKLSVLIAKDGTSWTVPLAPTNEYLYPTERDDLRRSFRFTGERDAEGRKVYREKRAKRFP